MKSITYDPDKWQLVPKEPTRDMLDGMNNATHVLNDLRSSKAYEYALYAAPQPEPCDLPQQVDVEPFGVVGDLFDDVVISKLELDQLTKVYLHPNPEVAKLRAERDRFEVMFVSVNDDLSEAENEVAKLREKLAVTRDEMMKAADQIRKCDYTPARSTLLVALAQLGEK